MERIDLFDKYINNQLSDAQRSKFDERLNSDEAFASEFNAYLLIVDGVCREARQDNIDFGVAMKKLSKEQLREIIGQRTQPQLPAPESSSASAAPERKAPRFKPWMWQAASIAAIVVISFTIVFKVEQNSRDAIDNAIYACSDINTDLTRSAGESVDITSMNDDQLKKAIPTLTQLYQDADTEEEVADNGYALAMAYLKLHDRDKAADTLSQLISRFDGNPDYAESVSKWKSILNLIK